MESELSSGGQDIVRELAATIVRSADYTVPAYGGVGEYNAEAFVRVRSALAEGGWNELLAFGAGGDEDIATIARVVEEVALKTDVLCFPLVENVTARRMLQEIGSSKAGEDTVALANVSQFFEDAAGTVLTFPYPGLADAFLALRRLPNEHSFEVVSFTADELQTTAQSVDESRPLGRVKDSVAGEVIGELSSVQAERLSSELLLLTAAELLGTADRLAAETRTHLSQREQFGRKLSSFQALRHRMVDSFVQIETLRSLVWYACWVADRSPELLMEYALLCKGQGAEAAWAVADEAIQLFGGMGFTWEQGLQFPAARIASRSLEAPAALVCLELAGRRAIARGSLTGLVA